MMRSVPLGRVSLAAVLLLGLTACATPARDRGLAQVQGLLEQRDAALAARSLGVQDRDTAELDAQTQALLAEPLTPDRAVGLALLRNAEVRGVYARLGLAQAEWLEASRLSNPVLSFSALDSDRSGERTRLGYGLTQNFTDLLFLGVRRDGADAAMLAAQAAAAQALQALASQVTEHWFESAGAEQSAQLFEVMARAARVSAELAQRFHDAGNFNALELARERAAAEQAELEALDARAAADHAKLVLAQSMGLAPDARWSLDSALPLPVADETPLDQLVALARTQRLDLLASQRDLAAVERARRLAQRLRWLPFLEVGLEGEREGDGERLLGPTLAFELPIFGKGTSGVLRTQALHEQVQAELAQLDIAIAAEVAREHAAVIAGARRVQRHREGLIPQREAIVARLQEMQNWMLVGQFDLLLAKREEYAAYAGYLDALRAYWLARTRLARAVGGALPSDTQIGARDQRAPTLPEASDADPHAHHHAPHGAHH